MSDKLDFSIPERGGKKTEGNRMNPVYILLAILILISIFNMYILLKGKPYGDETKSSLAPPDKELKQLALKLEKQDLNKQAVEAWKEYLSAASPDTVETARIWYRIGSIFQTNGDYDEALSAYYRSESFSKPDDIKNEINRKIQECLESAGKFASLRYELENRVGGDMKATEAEKSTIDRGDEVVAEIGSHKVTRSDLDKKIEKLIESRLRVIARYLSEEQINREKENLLKQYSSEKGRRAFLEQFMIEEMLYRKARETGLSEKKSVKESMTEMERSFLASSILEKAYNDEIKITVTDINNYYEANKEKYIKKEEDGKERQMELDEVKDRVAFDLMSEKEKDVQNKLISQLREEYDVVIHNSVFSTEDNNEMK